MEIADRIRDRVNVGVFVYSERQDELVGTDGVESFSRVFAEAARIVVILYREGWGETKWTRVEENAIRTRGFNEGHEFVLLVKLDAAKLPVWLPPTRIYLGFERYGIDGVASAIETRVQSVGGIVRTDSAMDHALRLQRETEFTSERKRWRYTGASEKAGKSEVEGIVRRLQHTAEEIENQTELRVGFHSNGPHHCVIRIGQTRLCVEGYRPTLSDVPTFILHVWILEGGMDFDEPTRVDEARYEIELDLSARVGWKRNGKFLTSEQIADSWLKRQLDYLRDQNMKNRDDTAR